MQPIRTRTSQISRCRPVRCSEILPSNSGGPLQCLRAVAPRTAPGSDSASSLMEGVIRCRGQEMPDIGEGIGGHVRVSGMGRFLYASDDGIVTLRICRLTERTAARRLAVRLGLCHQQAGGSPAGQPSCAPRTSPSQRWASWVRPGGEDDLLDALVGANVEFPSVAWRVAALRRVFHHHALQRSRFLGAVSACRQRSPTRRRRPRRGMQREKQPILIVDEGRIDVVLDGIALTAELRTLIGSLDRFAFLVFRFASRPCRSSCAIPRCETDSTPPGKSALKVKRHALHARGLNRCVS